MKKIFSALIAAACLSATVLGAYSNSSGDTWNISPDALRADINTALVATGAAAIPAFSAGDPDADHPIYSAAYGAGTVSAYTSGAQPYAISASLNTAQSSASQAEAYGAVCGAMLKVLAPNISVDAVNAAIHLDQTVPSAAADALNGYVNNEVLLTNQIQPNRVLFSAVRYPNKVTGIGLVVNNRFLDLDVPPRIVNSRTLVPLRGIFEEIGAQVTWDQKTKTATVRDDNHTIVIPIGSKTATVDGKTVSLDTPAELSATHGSARTLVPVRFIAEALGAQVGWVNAPQTVLISNQ